MPFQITENGAVIVESDLPDTDENRKAELANYRSSLNPVGQLPGATLGPATGPQRRAMMVPQTDDVRATMGQQFVGSLPTDPMQQVEYFATQFFPGMDVKQATSYFSYRPDGQLQVFNPETNENQLVKTDVQLTKPSTYLKGLPKQAGDLMTDIGAGTGAVVGALRGRPYLGTAIGTTVADTARQTLASQLADETKTPGERIGQTALRTGQELFFTKAGDVISKLIKIPDGFKGIANPSSNNLIAEAKKLGINLTQAEATKNSRAIILQKTLQNTPDAADIMDEFQTIRNIDVRQSLMKWIDTIQPNPQGRSSYDMAMNAQRGALDAINTEKNEIIAKATPFYEKSINDKSFAFVFEKPPGVSQQRYEQSLKQWQNLRGLAKKDKFLGPEIQVYRDRMFKKETDQLVQYEKQIQEIDDALIEQSLTQNDKNRLSREKGRLTKVYKKLENDIDKKFNNSMHVVDLTKKYVDKEIRKAEKNGDDALVGILQRTKTDILKTVDNQIPDYATARGIYEEGYPSLTPLTDGITGQIANRKELTAQMIPASVFNSNYTNPQTIKIMREAFNKAGRQDAWNDLTRAYLETELDVATRTPQGNIGNVGAKFYGTVFGNDKKQKQLLEALADNPQAQENLVWMAQTLEAINRSAGKESITSFANEAKAELRRQGEGMIPKFVRAIQFWKTPEQASQTIAELNQGRYAKKIANLLVEGKDINQIQKANRSNLYETKPGSKAAIFGLIHFLGSTGTQMIPEERADLPTISPQPFNQPVTQPLVQ
tara:strand:+ start:5278 stop:7596 length:2319 start_codon:yes stop_codon:yes gene_type:complete